MKRILITGADSYIGTSLEKYLSKWPEEYSVDTVDMMGDAWRNVDFGGYDSVFHVAGIAHSDSGVIPEEKQKLYFKVNTDLAVETAQKAKKDGVGQFVFMSSAIVYGNSAPIGKQKLIKRDTPPSPCNCYSESKLRAEEGIIALEDEFFKTVILRPPMIYGKGCRGNYKTLASLALKLPFFPFVENSRSMLYIGNLTEFVRLMIDNRERGIFWPQNSEYTNTSQMVALIAGAHGKKLRLVGGFLWVLKLLSHVTALVNKAFGNLCYDRAMSEYKTDYCIYKLEESIFETEVEE